MVLNVFLFTKLMVCYSRNFQATINPTTGAPWPMPQKYAPSNKVYIYKQIIFDTTLRFQPKHGTDTENALTVASVKVESECDIFPSLESDESYDLTVSETGILINANAVWGALRGLETFSQLIVNKEEQPRYNNFHVKNEFWNKLFKTGAILHAEVRNLIECSITSINSKNILLTITFTRYRLKTKNKTWDCTRTSYSVINLNSNKQQYRINLFHTTSRIEVNGRGRQEFLPHLQDIAASMDRKGNCPQLNKLLEQQIKQCIESMQTSGEASLDQSPSIRDCINNEQNKASACQKNQQIEHHCESLGTQRTNNERDILKNNSEPTSYIQKQNMYRRPRRCTRKLLKKPTQINENLQTQRSAGNGSNGQNTEIRLPKPSMPNMRPSKENKNHFLEIGLHYRNFQCAKCKRKHDILKSNPQEVRSVLPTRALAF
ncbi:HEXA_B [Mytilus coruscus]|uniref:HEXA_B n=1 Tax=Mytilus coruscus TaxID=42192 RepID=A0A6J8EK59_MYTCO|nr:HEXA_B [Mytilus coruscus]